MTVDELLVLIKARDNATRVFNTVRKNFSAFGKDMTRIGRDMSMKVTLPILAIGGAAVKMAVTFDEEMTKIITLVGVAESQVNKWRESILALAPAVGVGPAELARALFVVTSAGAEGANALRIVEQAAKASALGLGETATTARAVTAAMQAYSSEGLTAARATEILVKTVEKGSLEASALAGSLGKVLGVAAQVGVSFEEVGGFIATFTRLGVSAEEAVTSLRGVIKVFLKPTEQMEKALRSVNLSSERLRETLGEIGLAGTLRLLVDRFKDSEKGLSMVIPEVEALAGVLGTAGVQGEAYTKIVEEINTHMGFMAERFQRAKDTPAQQWKEFKATVAVLAIELGNKLIPTFIKILDVVKKVIGWFTSLSEKNKDLILKVTGLVAAIGPLLMVFGGLSAALFFILSPAGLVVAALAALGVGIVYLANDWKNASLKISSWWAWLVDDISNSILFLLTGMSNAFSVLAPNLSMSLAEAAISVEVFRNKTLAGLGKKMLETERLIAESAANIGIDFSGLGPSGEQMAADLAAAMERMMAAFGALGAPTGKMIKDAKQIGEEMNLALWNAAVLAEHLGSEFDLVSEKSHIFRRAIEELAAAGFNLDAIIPVLGISLRELIDMWSILNEEMAGAAEKTKEQTELANYQREVLSAIKKPLDDYADAIARANAALTAGLIDQAQFAEFVRVMDEQLADATRPAVDEAARAGQQIGQALVGGVIRGMDSKDLWDQVLWVIETFLIKAVMTQLGIASASKVAIGWGQSIREGLALGMASGGPMVDLSVLMPAGGLSFGVPGGAAGGVGLGSAPVPSLAVPPASAGPTIHKTYHIYPRARTVGEARAEGREIVRMIQETD